MIIAVLDVQLRYERCDKESFQEILNDHLVLLGDILKFWRRNIVSVALSEEILACLQRLNANVHYIVGNLDHFILNWREKFAK